MNEKDFFEEYESGRRDWKGKDLRGLDLFTPFIKSTHPEFFSINLSKLIRKNHPVINKPIHGVNLTKTDFSNSSLINSSMLKASFEEANLKYIDARLTSLSGADFSQANLEGADLRYSNLSSTNFTNCKLDSTKIDHCNIMHSNFYRANFYEVSATFSNFSFSSMNEVAVCNSNFDNSCFYLSDLSNSKLDKSYFRESRLHSMVIRKTKIAECDFSEIQAIGIDARFSDISWTVFKNNNLQGSNFSDSILSQSDFKGSNLSYTNLDHSIIDGVDFNHVKFYYTSFNKTSIKKIILGNTILSNIDLTPFVESTVSHHGQSSVDDSSIAKTIINNPIHPQELDPCSDLRKFIELCGMPNVVAMYMIDSIRTLQPEQLVSLMRSTFISYGTPNEEFAVKLNSDLRENGVATFFYPNDAPFGEKLYSTMKRVDNYDRIILICSEKSLNRAGVQYELEKTLEREARDGGQSYLIPITLDRYLFDQWQPKRNELRSEVLNRVVADFSNNENYDNQFERLLRVLKKEFL